MRVLCLSLALLAPQISAAETYVFTLKGLTAATLTVSGTTSATGYSATGTLKSAGALGAIKKIRYDAKSSGKLDGGKLVPSRYWERADTPKRQSELTMTYRSGRPSALTYSPARAGAAPALGQHAGSLDPLTALFTVLRDQPEAETCKAAFQTFDGKRAAKVALKPAAKTADSVTCAGSYTRVSGFSAREMADKTRFDFTLTYLREGGVMRVSEISLDTIIGKGRLTRR